MTSEITIAAIFIIYILGLLGIATTVERSSKLRSRCSRSPLIYALSLTVYHTAWSFYGIVGEATNTGLAFLTTYIGSTLGICLWPNIMRRIIRIKTTQRITSVADFISARYNRSTIIAAIVTCMCLLGTLPYVSIQIKAILFSLNIVTGASNDNPSILTHAASPILAIVIILFTIIVGVRRLDPTERHQGVVVAIAIESIIKISAILILGIYVTYFVFDGFGDIFTRISVSPWANRTGLNLEGGQSYTAWMTGIFSAMSAIFFLPRQFHVAVVENSDENHLRHAVWIVPLYMLLFSLFAFPIAMGGLLSGFSPSSADTFVLLFPIQNNKAWLAYFVFFGGLSAGMGMIIITTMTMATMITNHILLPIIQKFPPLRMLKRWLLQCRWGVTALFISLGFLFNAMVGDAYMIVSMGSLSFAAITQLAPVAIGGLYWRRATSKGAMAALSIGFFTWFYTLLIPAFAKGGWLPMSILTEGPFGLKLLAPEQLLGLTNMAPLPHSFFWSLLFNIGSFIIVSLATSDQKELTEAHHFIDSYKPKYAPLRTSSSHVPHIDVAPKIQLIETLFSEFYPPAEAAKLTQRCVNDANLVGRQLITIDELSNFCSVAEAILTGSIGASMAHHAILHRNLYTKAEAEELSTMYANILSQLQLSPDELRKKIDYYEERQNLLSSHAKELEKAYEKLKDAEKKYRTIFENALEGIFQTTLEGKFITVNPALAKIIGYESVEDVMRSISNIADQLYINSNDRKYLLDNLLSSGAVYGFEHQVRRKDGSIAWVEVNAKILHDEEGKPSHIEGAIYDISSRKEAEQKLMLAHDYIVDVINSMPSIMVSVNEQLEITHWNKAAHQDSGLPASSVTGRHITDVYPDIEQRISDIEKALREKTPFEIEKHIRKHNGETRITNITIFPLSSSPQPEAVIRIDDITERVKMENIMIQTEKMMSVGGLAAGMAHEINNPLGGILQAVQNIRRRTSPSLKANAKIAEDVGCPLDRMNEYLEQRKIYNMLDGIQESGERAAGIISNMLEFSRRSDSESKKPEDIHVLIDKALEISQKDYDLKKSYDFKNITLDRRYAEALPPVPCVGSEIEQVLLNLFKNAAQAMTEHGSQGPPTITVTTALENGMVAISIADNGPGMDEQTQRKAFEPFYTTKGVGVGTGLGLSVSFFIITSNHKGKLTLESAPGQGTTFTIHLPIQPQT